MPHLPRRPLLAALAFSWIAAAASTARAAERAPWSDATFAAAQAAGRPLIVEVTAPWCPTCRAQAPHVAATLAEPALASALLLTVDFDTQVAFDTQKDALRRLGVRQQSTPRQARMGPAQRSIASRPRCARPAGLSSPRWTMPPQPAKPA